MSDDMSIGEFIIATLQSADEDSAVHPPPFSWWHGTSTLQGMIIKGWLCRREGRGGGSYVITDAGRRQAAKGRVDPDDWFPGLGAELPRAALASQEIDDGRSA